ncbi:MAG: S41 family peptidase, partial [Rhodocyclaceae bacterium]|nr:S41 family peptidase [Rhodocyclaceae bacterium]
LRLTTALYYTPAGKSIQGKGIIPDILVEETANGGSRERLREADLERHLTNDKEGKEAEKPVQTKKDKGEKDKGGMKPQDDEAHAAPLEFASKNDYQLSQAMNLLKAWQVIKK